MYNYDRPVLNFTVAEISLDAYNGLLNLKFTYASHIPILTEYVAGICPLFVFSWPFNCYPSKTPMIYCVSSIFLKIFSTPILD